MIYLDTSVVAAIFFREPGAAKLVARLESQRRRELVVSAWVLTEMASAAGIKQRTGALDPAEAQEALAHFHRFTSTHLRTVEVDPVDFRAAVTLLDGSDLRAGDALHLAICRRIGADLASIDRRLCKAAKREHITLLALG